MPAPAAASASSSTPPGAARRPSRALGVRSAVEPRYPLRQGVLVQRPGVLGHPVPLHPPRPAELRCGSPADVAGIATTSQREGCVFLDAHGTEIYAGPNIDARGFNEGFEVLNTLGNERLYAITGHSAPFIFPLARYLWFRKHGTGAVAHLLMINDWMTYRLSGELRPSRRTPPSPCCSTSRSARWSDEILDTFDIPRGILPPLYGCGDRVGALTAAAAAATGLAGGHAGVRRRRGHAMLAAGRRRHRARRNRRHARDDDAGANRRRSRRLRSHVQPLGRVSRGAGPLGLGEQCRRHRRRLSLVARSRQRRTRHASSSTSWASSWRPRASRHRRCCLSARRSSTS